MKHGPVIIALAALVASPPIATAAPPAECGRLVEVELTAATVTSAEPLAAGTFAPPTGAELMLERRACRVTIVATPAAGSRIGIELWLPDPLEWNGRFWGLGNGGFGGSIAYARLAQGTAAGYAVVSTDGGNATPGNTAWARGESERVADLGHRAAHLAAVHGKRLTEAFFGRPPRFAYFSGFSTGGSQALMLAQRYPDDYDGILAGGAEPDWTHLYFSSARPRAVR
jgi:feruloyl esterase